MKIIKNHRRGQKMSPIYKCWLHMRGRCLTKTDRKYPDYGGRGITICVRWDSFENFYADMGDKPDGLTLGRIDNDGNYEPSNCRWETAEDQAWNRRQRSFQSNNKSGLPGVRYIASRGKYQATAGRSKTLYWGPDFFEACCARKSWERDYYGVKE